MLQCVAVCCSVLQCAAVCCSMLQCVAVCCSAMLQMRVRRIVIVVQKGPVLQCVAVCVEACVAVFCNVLQHVAVCCSVLQCVATVIGVHVDINESCHTYELVTSHI